MTQGDDERPHLPPSDPAAAARLYHSRKLGTPFVVDVVGNRFAAVHRLASDLRANDSAEHADRVAAGIITGYKPLRADQIAPATGRGQTNEFRERNR